MKAITKYLMMAAASLLLTTACSNEYDESPAPAKQGKPVQFDMTLAGVNSRTVTGTDASRTTTWVEGDAVGIFAYKRGDTTTPTAINAKYVLQGANWVAEGTAIFAEDGQQYDYYAYYPYKEGVENPAAVSLASLADQTTAEGVNYGLSDVMGSQNKTVAADAQTIPLVFKHLFAMVEVKVIGDADLLTKQPASVVLKGVKLGATLNLLGDAPVATVNAEEAGSDVTMYYLTKTADNDKAPFAYRAVVPAQTIAAKTSLVAVNGVNEAGKSYELQFSTAVTYEASKFRVITVKIGAPKASITIPAGDITIDPWGESEAIDGEGSEVPVTSLTLTLPTDLSAFTDLGIYTVDKLSGNTDFWFHRENKTAATTLSIDAAEGGALKSVTVGTTRGSWNNSNYGYHSASRFERAQYTLTFMVQVSDGVDGAVGIGVSSSNDDKFFQMKDTKWADWYRTATTYNKLGSGWVEKSVNLDFTNSFPEGKSSNITGLPIPTDGNKVYNYTPTEDADVQNGINIYFYNYGLNNSLHLKDIRIVKYVAP